MRTSSLLWSVVSLSLCVTAGSAHAETQRLFSFRAPLGARPTSLVRISSGVYCGATAQGGAHGHGALYTVGRSGGLSLLYSFTGVEDGIEPRSLVRGGDGTVYGLSTLTPQADRGYGLAVFKLAASSVQVLQRFDTFAIPDGAARLVQAPDGVYVSTTHSGAIFHVAADGALRTLYTFADGSWASTLIAGQDGLLYGTTASTSSADPSSIFRLTSAGAFTALTAFDPSASIIPTALARNPEGALYIAARAADAGVLYRLRSGKLTQLARTEAAITALITGRGGDLYAASAFAGPARAGSLLRISSGGAVRVLHTFASGSDGAAPSDITYGPEGLAGATSNAGAGGFGTVFRVRSSSGLKTLHSFAYPDGASPGALVRGSDGNLYGAAQDGGEHGAGTIFRATPSGEVTSLHAFSGSDGAAPSTLTVGSDGVLYGRTLEGGAAGLGTVFSLSSDGTLTTLHSFDQARQSAGPALVRSDDGTLYGADQKESGHLFRIRPGAGFEVIYTFPGLQTRDGATPSALVQGPEGVLFGATAGAYGPMIPTNFSSGTIFRLGADGTFETLYAFNEDRNELGASPRSLISGADGTLYGATSNITFLCGVAGKLFKLAPGASKPELVYGFTGQEGAGPVALVAADGGKLFGITVGGKGAAPAESCQPKTSTVFGFDPAAGFDTLGSFDYATFQAGINQLEQTAALVDGGAGKLFGVTANGGEAGAGELFSLELAQ